MMHENNLFALLILFGAAAALVGMFVALSAWLGPRKTNPVKEEPFECGWIHQTDARRPFPIKYYLVAVIFIVFDVELAFLYPWAVAFGAIGVVGYIFMMVFLAVLGIGLFYETKKRILEWK